MSSNFSQIPPLTTELAALERLKDQRHYFFSVAIDQILFRLRVNADMQNILDEFKGLWSIRPIFGLTISENIKAFYVFVFY